MEISNNPHYKDFENPENNDIELKDNPRYKPSDSPKNFEENSEYFASQHNQNTEIDDNSITPEMEINYNSGYVGESNVEKFEEIGNHGDSNKSEMHSDNDNKSTFSEIQINDNPCYKMYNIPESFENDNEYSYPRRSEADNYATVDCADVQPEDIEQPIKVKRNQMKLHKKVEYTFNTIGYVVGLGNIWRFSNLCYEYGGGTFLFVYTINYIVIGLPLFMLEMYIGQFTSRGSIECWGNCRLLRAVGVGTVALTISIMYTYMMFIVWSLKYLVLSFFNPLPWSNKSIPILDSTTFSANEYFMNEGFHISKSTGIGNLGLPQWEIILAGFFGWLFIFLCLFKGMKLSGKAVYITVLFPYLSGFILLIQSVNLPGSKQGLRDYMSTTNFISHINNKQLWSDAAIQLLFSLSLAQGGLACLSSLNDFRSNILASSVAVTLTDYLTSIFLGIIVFSYIGFVKYYLKINIDEISWNGVTILFVIIPQAISNTNVPNLWSIIFFLHLISLAFDVMLTFTRTVCLAISEQFSYVKKLKDIYINSVFCFLSFLTTIALSTSGGYFLFYLIKQYGDSWTMLINALLSSSLMILLYGGEEITIDISYMLKERRITTIIWKFMKYYFMACWYLVTPIFLIYLLIATWVNIQIPFTLLGYSYPPWSIMFGWLIALCPPVATVVIWIVYFVTTKGSLKRRFQYLKNLNPGEPLWSIASTVDMEGLQEFKRKLNKMDK